MVHYNNFYFCDINGEPIYLKIFHRQYLECQIYIFCRRKRHFPPWNMSFIKWSWKIHSCPMQFICQRKILWFIHSTYCHIGIYALIFESFLFDSFYHMAPVYSRATYVSVVAGNRMSTIQSRRSNNISFVSF